MNDILVRGNLMERRNQMEQGKHSSLAQRVQDLVHAGDGRPAEAAYFVEFLVVGGDLSVSRLLWDDHQRARIRRGRAGSGLPRGTGSGWRQLPWWGREVTGALPSGTEISKGIREQEPKYVLGLEKTSEKLQRTSPSFSIAKRVQPGP